MDLKSVLLNLQCELVAERNTVNPKEISWLQYDILFQLTKEKETLPSQLSLILGVSRTKLSKSLKSLKEKGYVIQYPNSQDGRELYTSITEEGISLLQDISKKHDHLYNIASKVMSEKEQEEFIRLSRKISEELRKDRLANP